MKNNANINVSVNVNNSNLDCYITIDGKDIPCTREVYLAYKQPIRKEAMRTYRNKRPFINGERCSGDCEHCKADVIRAGCPYVGDVSAEQMVEDGTFNFTAHDDIESEAYASLLLEKMQKELETESQICIDIFNLMLEELPQREISAKLGIADGTVTYYIKKIRTKLAKFK